MSEDKNNSLIERVEALRLKSANQRAEKEKNMTSEQFNLLLTEDTKISTIKKARNSKPRVKHVENKLDNQKQINLQEENIEDGIKRFQEELKKRKENSKKEKDIKNEREKEDKIKKIQKRFSFTSRKNK